MIMRVTKRTEERQAVHEAILPWPRHLEWTGQRVELSRTYTNGRWRGLRSTRGLPPALGYRLGAD